MAVMPHFEIGFRFTSFILVTTGGVKIHWKCKRSSQKLLVIKIELWVELDEVFFSSKNILLRQKYVLGKITFRHGNHDRYHHHHPDNNGS